MTEYRDIIGVAIQKVIEGAPSAQVLARPRRNSRTCSTRPRAETRGGVRREGAGRHSPGVRRARRARADLFFFFFFFFFLFFAMLSLTGPVATPARASGRVGSWAHRNARWLFPAPAVLLVATIIVYPVVYTVWMSLQEWIASSLTPPKLIGLANYWKILFGDPRFQEAVVRTLYFTAPGDRRRDGARGGDGAPVQPGVLGARPPADARNPAHGGDPRRHRPRLRDDVPPDARGGQLHAVRPPPGRRSSGPTRAGPRSTRWRWWTSGSGRRSSC